MAKQDVITVEAVVTEALPNANFRVRLENDVVIVKNLSTQTQETVKADELTQYVVQLFENEEECSCGCGGKNGECLCQKEKE